MKSGVIEESEGGILGPQKGRCVRYAQHILLAKSGQKSATKGSFYRKNSTNGNFRVSFDSESSLFANLVVKIRENVQILWDILGNFPPKVWGYLRQNLFTNSQGLKVHKTAHTYQPNVCEYPHDWAEETSAHIIRVLDLETLRGGLLPNF